ncbi:hypothetical protein STIAU_3811 [Stigmatella aurantiaca DW4/3-1]|uniref:Uncharacterized protein n=1 Tax=Stigmatella aurantiaca (strain DW4/3-1) TaxID=378806 RepID=Q090W7_STIAD|nr:hypothetical protein STIAU_3811 [Stigmatella aurantiaca DW4/3-1]
MFQGGLVWQHQPRGVPGRERQSQLIPPALRPHLQSAGQVRRHARRQQRHGAGQAEGVGGLEAPRGGEAQLLVAEDAQRFSPSPEEERLVARHRAATVRHAHQHHAPGVVWLQRHRGAPLPAEVIRPPEVAPVVVVVGGRSLQPPGAPAERDGAVCLQPRDKEPGDGTPGRERPVGGERRLGDGNELQLERDRPLAQGHRQVPAAVLEAQGVAAETRVRLPGHHPHLCLLEALQVTCPTLRAMGQDDEARHFGWARSGRSRFVHEAEVHQQVQPLRVDDEVLPFLVFRPSPHPRRRPPEVVGACQQLRERGGIGPGREHGPGSASAQQRAKVQRLRRGLGRAGGGGLPRLPQGLQQAHHRAAHGENSQQHQHLALLCRIQGRGRDLLGGGKTGREHLCLQPPRRRDEPQQQVQHGVVLVEPIAQRFKARHGCPPRPHPAVGASASPAQRRRPPGRGPRHKRRAPPWMAPPPGG